MSKLVTGVVRHRSFAVVAVLAMTLSAATEAFGGRIHRAPERHIVAIPGKFVAWRNSNEVVTTDGSGFSVLNVHTLARETIPSEAPDPSDLRMIWAPRSETASAPFPGRITNKLSGGGQMVWWRIDGMVIHEGGQARSDPLFAPSSNLIDRADGEVAIYFSPKGEETNEAPRVKTADRRASYSIVHRTGTRYRILPLDFDPAIAQGVLGSGYRWWNLGSRRDEATGRYLVFFSKEVFLYSPKMYGGAGWSPFNVWWLEIHDNPGDDVIEHITLPNGPWLEDAQSDGAIRRLRCSPFECDYFRSYDFKAAGHKVFARISEFRDVLSEDTLGVYVLDASERTWLKVGDADMTLTQVSPDGCTVATNRKQNVEVDDLCSSTPGN